MRYRYPRRVDGLIVVVDVDGTVMEPAMGTAGIPYGDPEALAVQKPNKELVARLLGLEQSGFVVRFCSGRGQDLRDVTIGQLEAAGFRDVDERLVLQDGFRGIFELRAFKRRQHEQAVLGIGDQRVDLDAAMQAGATFMSAIDFAAGDPLDFMFCWTCGCTALRACDGGCSWANGRQCSRCAASSNLQLEVLRA